MKFIPTILILTGLNANATIYYVSNSGSDAANGTSTGTSWLTVAKVNASTFSAGDQILFNKGNTWNERLNPPSSGSIGNPIIIGAYGTGVKPVITGFQAVTGFTNVGNVWAVTATSAVSSLNTVVINGRIAAKGRYPNYGWLQFDSLGVGGNSVKTNLSGTPNYGGGEVAVRITNWVIDVTRITSQSGGTLNVSPALSYGSTYLGTTGYFIENIASVLDTLNEWTIDASKVLKVYQTTSPTVQVSTIDTLCYIKNRNYITFDGISFTGSNMVAMQLDSSNNITIQNCSLNNNGAYGIAGTVLNTIKVLSDSIQNSLSDGIRFDPVISLTVTGNYIKNSGAMAGMGRSGDQEYEAVYYIGINGTVTNNRIDSSGYIGINFRGINTVIKNNYVNTFGYIKDDGGGIYTFIGLGNTYGDTSSVIRSNIVINGGGANGVGVGSYSAGIYLDDGVRGITVDSNTVYNCTSAGIFFKGIYNSFLNNIVWAQTNSGIYHYGNFGGSAFHFTVKGNVIYKPAPEYGHYCFQMDNSNTLESIDSNFYLMPGYPEDILGHGPISYSLPEWQAYCGYDMHSHITPTGITSAGPVLYYNATLSNSIIPLSGVYIDGKGVSHTNSITITPFASTILFKAVFIGTGSIGNLYFQ